MRKAMQNYPRLQLIITMLVFGTIGTFARFIDMPSSMICLGRAFFAALTLLVAVALGVQTLDKEAIKRNIGWLVLSSFLMCFNWICQFEAYKYTTIATSTLCYYMQPVFYMLGGAIVLKEKLTGKKIICMLIAFAGMILVSGVLQTGLHLSELRGVIFAVTGGFFYAMVVLVNKYMKDIAPINTTVMQMIMVTVIMIPYNLATGAAADARITAVGVICLLTLGIVHTGICYVYYFGAVNRLSAQTVGILNSYLFTRMFWKENKNAIAIAKEKKNEKDYDYEENCCDDCGCIDDCFLCGICTGGHHEFV